MTRILAIVPLLALGACAGHHARTVVVDPPEGAGGPADGDRMYICEMERETGSNIMQRVCRPAKDEDREQRRERTQLMMQTTSVAQPQQR